jgi:pimeloyl-ACP methyl ester carboxylesterase
VNGTARIATRIIVGVAIACGALALFNVADAAVRRSRNPPLGKFYSIEGRAMHMYCIGTGSPAIVLEAGSGDDVLYWQTIQPALSKVTRVCSYDRAGIGWSEPQARPRDADTIMRQLHALLDSAGVARPFVLAGASAGGFYVREFAREHPSELAAVALLDASSPEQLDELPGSRAWYTAGLQSRPRAAQWEKLSVLLGWKRLLGRCHSDPPPGLDRLRGAVDAEECRPRYVGADLAEWLDFDTAGKQAARLASFGDIPLLIVSQDPDRPKSGWTADAVAAQPIWAREQEHYKSFSTRSWRVVAHNSGHHVHHDRPDVVIGELNRLLAYLRHGSGAPPFGTTTVE